MLLNNSINKEEKLIKELKKVKEYSLRDIINLEKQVSEWRDKYLNLRNKCKYSFLKINKIKNSYK